MKLRFTPRAVSDLDAIAEYLARRNPGAATRVRTAVIVSLERLVQFPESGGGSPLSGSGNSSPVGTHTSSTTRLMWRLTRSWSSPSSIRPENVDTRLSDVLGVDVANEEATNEPGRVAATGPS